MCGRTYKLMEGSSSKRGEPWLRRDINKEIHKKVMSLKFRDCHTKIRHVDALATLGDGVVVQVMGELSNAGLPMRRFMQTFVLAPEGSVPNKFYVHNDIFRYQDEVVDSDGDVAEGNIVEQPEPIKDRVSETEQQSCVTPVPEPLSDDFDGPIDGPVPALGKRKEEIVGEIELPAEKQEVVKPAPSPTPADNTPPQQPKVGPIPLAVCMKCVNKALEVVKVSDRVLACWYVDSVLLTMQVSAYYPSGDFCILPVMLRGDVRLNVEEKKSRPIREGDRRPIGDEWRDTRRAERGGFGGGRGGPGGRDNWGLW
uniref:NTF2 domain-containing protein n=1 Tax=Eptatretus burgeri TaxID=7764 RepID=A0A8C4R6G2_EPTBU